MREAVNGRGHPVGCTCAMCRTDAQPLEYPNNNQALNPTLYNPEMGAGFDAD